MEGVVNEVATQVAAIAENYTLDLTPRRILLFNPPVYDTRFPWSQYQQPVTLLQVAALLKQHSCDIRLIDALNTAADADLPRRRMRILQRSDTSINYWRFGASEWQLQSQLRTFKIWRVDQLAV
jgi:hypothetical protein